jgi:hypothetical protein
MAYCLFKHIHYLCLHIYIPHHWCRGQIPSSSAQL